MRRTLLVLLLLTLAPIAAAQFTNVTGTVTDANGIAYDCGTITATIVNNNGQNLYLNGQLYTPAPSPVQLGCALKGQTSGAFTMSVGDNTQIKCGSGISIVACGIQTQWTFQAAIAPGILPPAGTGPQTCSATLTISGTSQSVTSSFLTCPALTKSTGGVGSGAGPVMAYYLSSNCPSFDPDGVCFNTPGNTRVDNTCTWSNASTTVTCTDTPFVAGDVGKQVMGWHTCSTDLPIAQYGGAITSGTTVVTISTFTDSNHVVLSGTPANSQATSPSCFIFGNPDDTAASALDAAYSVQKGFCPRIMLAAAQYLFTKPHFAAQPPGCSTLPSQFGSPNFGNLDLPSGLDVEGRGSGATTIYLANNFPNGAPKTTYNSISAWFAIPPLGGWSDLQISGGGQAGTCAGITGGDVLLYMAVAKMHNVTLTNFCSIPGNTTSNFYLTEGVYADCLSQFNMTNFSAWGAVELVVNGCLEKAFQLAVENAGTAGVTVLANTADFYCNGCYLAGGETLNLTQNGGNNQGAINLNTNSTAHLYNSLLTQCGAPACNNNAQNPVIINTAGTGVKLYLQGNVLGPTNAATNTSTVGILSQVGKSITINARDNSIAGGSANFSINLQNNADVLNDEGGNTINTAPYIGANLTNPTIIADGHAMTGSCTGVATSASTLGLYNTEWNPTNTTTTCTIATIGAGKVMSQARTMLALKASATAAGTNASSGVVTVLVNGGASAMTCTIGTGTLCQDVTHTLSLNPGDRVAVQFTTQAADTLAGVKALVWWQ